MKMLVARLRLMARQNSNISEVRAEDAGETEETMGKTSGEDNKGNQQGGGLS